MENTVEVTDVRATAQAYVDKRSDELLQTSREQAADTHRSLTDSSRELREEIAEARLTLERQASAATERLGKALDAQRTTAAAAASEAAGRSAKLDEDVVRLGAELAQERSLIKSHGQALATAEASMRDEYQKLDQRVSLEVRDQNQIHF